MIQDKNIKEKQKAKKKQKSESIGFSNQLFAYYNPKQSQDIHIYLPAYLRIKIKTIKTIQLDQLESQINLTLLLAIYYEQFDEHIQNFIKTSFSIHFRRNNVLLLQQGKNSELNVKHNQKFANFTIRKILKSRVEPYVYYTPLELLDQILTMNIRPVLYQYQQNEDTAPVRLLFHLNFMQTQVKQRNSNIHIVMDHTQKVQHGGYKLAQGRMDFQYTNRRLPKSLQALGKNFYSANIYQKDISSPKNITEDIQKPQCYDYAHFHIPIFKNPIVSGAIIYLPLAILSVLNLSIFFTEANLANRLTNIATLLIAFVQLIPIIRQQIPPTPQLTVTELIVVFESITAMLCLLSTFLIKLRGLTDLDDDQFAEAYNPWTDTWFILALLTTLLVILAPILMFGYYFLYLKKSHQRVKKGEGLVDYLLFYNYNNQANDYFYSLYQSLKTDQSIKLIYQFDDEQMKQRQKICEKAEEFYLSEIKKKQQQKKNQLTESNVDQKDKPKATQSQKIKKQEFKHKKQESSKDSTQTMNNAETTKLLQTNISTETAANKQVKKQKDQKKDQKKEQKKEKKKDKYDKFIQQMTKFNKPKIERFHQKLKQIIQKVKNRKDQQRIMQQSIL